MLIFRRFGVDMVWLPRLGGGPVPVETSRTVRVAGFSLARLHAIDPGKTKPVPRRRQGPLQGVRNPGVR